MSASDTRSVGVLFVRTPERPPNRLISSGAAALAASNTTARSSASLAVPAAASPMAAVLACPRHAPGRDHRLACELRRPRSGHRRRTPSGPLAGDTALELTTRRAVGAFLVPSELGAGARVAQRARPRREPH